MIEKSELKYLGLSLIVVLFLVIAMNFSPLNGAISSLNPIFQFLLINMGLYFIFFFVVKGVALKQNLGKVFQGALGTTLGFIAMDIILPPYLISSSQGLLSGGIFAQSSSDYFFGYIYSTYLGITGIWLPIMVYFVTFIVLFGIASLLIRNFVKKL